MADIPLPMVLQGSRCLGCKYRRLITSGSGSVFLLCQYGLVEESWPKYPSQPVAECRHFQEARIATKLGE